jgi:hypothetical protein
MAPRARPGNIIVTVVVAMGAIAFSPGIASAQWGWGWGFGGFSQVPKPESFLNSKALISAAHPPAIPSRNVYANNPNSYINHIRDNGFVDRYSVARREPLEYRYPPQPQPTPTAPRTPNMPLASFFNADNHFVWPADSPTEGDLKEKQSMFDQASQAVLSESKKNGVASIAAVTEARQKLVDYGKPALSFVRAHETPRIADLFHVFLLSVYESLAQAVNPGAAPAGTAGSPGGAT